METTQIFLLLYQTVTGFGMASTIISKDAYRWIFHSDLIFEGYRFNGSIFLRQEGIFTLPTQCALACLKQKGCLSYNFSHRDKICELSKDNHEGGHQGHLFAHHTFTYHLRNALELENVAFHPTECGHGLWHLDGDQWKQSCICSPHDTTPQCGTSQVEPSWMPWAEWTDCSVSCGGGWRRRWRECGHGDQHVDAHFCVGSDLGVQTCHTPCPAWSTWTEYGACSTASTCGSGVQSRARSCLMGDLEVVDSALCPGEEGQRQGCEGLQCSAAIQLVNITDTGSGTVQIFDHQNKRWVNICLKHEDDLHLSSDIACKQLSYSGTSKESPRSSQPTSSMQYIMDDLECTGEEGSVTSCQHGHVISYSPTICQLPLAVACIVDGGWGMWSDWGPCSASCGSGEQQRTRQCDHPPPRRSGKACQGEQVQSQPCQDSFCSVDGVWGSWGVWAECSLPCGGGSQSRERSCSPPLYGGQDCLGEPSEDQSCNEHPCPVDGIWETWTEWQLCTVSCGGGTRTRSRSCISPEHGGNDCQGDGKEEEECETIPCPVDGYYEPWSEWSTCSVTCEEGTRIRERTCVQPEHGGVDCVGDSREESSCDMGICPVDGYWEAWSTWSECSTSCAAGVSSRNRTCVPPIGEGADCLGDTDELEACDLGPCPVDGMWSEWSDWVSCSESCAGGEQSRSRSCEGTAHGGRECEGETEETQPCNQQPCPIDGMWHTWSVWSECLVDDCGDGHQQRNRSCEGPYYGGQECLGDYVEQTPCSISCKQPGEWLEWSEWSLCSVTCGGGQRYKTRECNMTTYGDMTSECIGINSTSNECHNFDCEPIGKTCKDYAERGLEDSVPVEIMPSYSVMWARCNLTEDEPMTEITHGNQERAYVHGYESSGEYARILKYNVSLSAIDELMAVVGSCKQYIRWECRAAAIKNPIDPDTAMTYWVNKYNEPKYYWGGASPDTDNCACGMDGSCFDPDKKCNCDANDEILREDSGFITDMIDLPITGFYAGDTGGVEEEGYVTLGPLQCFGDPMWKK